MNDLAIDNIKYKYAHEILRRIRRRLKTRSERLLFLAGKKKNVIALWRSYAFEEAYDLVNKEMETIDGRLRP